MAAPPADVWICECGGENLIYNAPDVCPLCGRPRPNNNKASILSTIGPAHQKDADSVTQYEGMDNQDMVVCCQCGVPSLIALSAQECLACHHVPSSDCKCAVAGVAGDNESDIWDHPNE